MISRGLLIVATPYGAFLSIYGVATISKLLIIIGLFCKRALYKRRYSAKEIYDGASAKEIHDGAYLSICGVATISKLLIIIGLFCKRALYKRRYSATEIYDCKEPTKRSHPIRDCVEERDLAYLFQEKREILQISLNMRNCRQEAHLAHQ